MPNEPKADWDVKPAALRLIFEIDAALVKDPTDRIIEDIAERHLTEAHASGAREAGEKLGRAMARLAQALELVAEYEAQWGDDYLAKKWGLRELHQGIREGMKADGPDASRVGGKETK
jgi:hypothetical protein